ncbi:MAG: hypothetical protein OXK77_12620 [Gemmatimonadota bacterium]|nr:hypothetical protein [Gemmatimonadota bacterium]MDE2864091.1 hypothetical protein [Gemmatimonadota bacterium]
MGNPPRDFIGCDLCDREDTAGLRKAIVAERSTVRDLRRALASAKRRIAGLEETVNWLRAERGAGAAYALG